VVAGAATVRCRRTRRSRWERLAEQSASASSARTVFISVAAGASVGFESGYETHGSFFGGSSRRSLERLQGGFESYLRVGFALGR
jgi:hypothetical protein